MFSIAIVYGFKILFPEASTGDSSFFDKLVDETLAGGLFVLGFFIPLYEELRYRVLPYVTISIIFFLFGNAGVWHWIGVLIVVTSTTRWVLAHGLRTPVIAPLGVFYGYAPDYITLLEYNTFNRFVSTVDDRFHYHSDPSDPNEGRLHDPYHDHSG